MPSEKKFYLTTPIYYVNARPHIGHAYSTIVADVIARRHRLLGDDTYFLTGTDEHGQKIERSAAAAGIPPQEFTDQVSKTFSDLWKRMGITNDDFIRTTEPRHKRGVQKLFATLQANDAIYLDTYTGQYCVSDEAYVEVGPGEPCPDCGRITETISESNYYFKLSKYQKELIELIEPGLDGANGQLNIQPAARRNEVLSFLRGNVSLASVSDVPVGAHVSLLEEDALALGKLKRSKGGTTYVPGALKDLSISRTSFKWGITVPGDEAHVIYVWLDALANYMTALGYGSDAPEDIAKFERYWPANLHLVGKEIIRFHCVYWPAFLLAAKLPLPKSIVANGWLLFEDSKMSKSRGNVVRTETILDAFGSLCPPIPQPLSSFAEGGGSAVPPEAPQMLAPTKQQQDLFATDVLRYFLLREIPFGQDGSFSFDALVQRYNSDLANGYGNLVSRTLKMIENYCGGVVPRHHDKWVQGALSIDYENDIATPIPGSDTLEEYAALASHIVNEKFELFLFSGGGQGALSDPNRTWGVLDSIYSQITHTDSFITRNAPWKLASQSLNANQTKIDAILYYSVQSIRIITALLHPILPYATAQVWSQLGLGDIEAAAKNGELKNLKWGGLKPGTKLGPLSPIFPRADKGLIQIMIDTEERNAQEAAAAKESASKPAEHATNPGVPLLDSEKWVSTAPDSPPRTSSLAHENPGAHVAASAAITTERTGTPPHHEAPASAPFAAAAAASVIPDTPQIAIDDFVKIDLRVAKIIVAERIPKADKLLRLEVDFGYEKRQILSGIAEWYMPEELIGRTIVVIANLAPRKMRGLESHGMLLAASHGENGKPVLATFGEEIELGARLR